MCVVPEKSSTSTDSNGQDVMPPPTCTNSSTCVNKEMEILGRDETDCISVLLELAANDDLEGFEQAIKEDKTKVYGVGAWYCRQNGKNQMVLEQRTPVMIAALYGSLGVLECILNLFDCPQDINRTCGFDGSTALHCAAAGGSTRALETVKLLLKFGADLNLSDAMGRRPADVIATHPSLGHIQVEMETILKAVKSIRRPIHIDVPEGIESDFPLFLDEVSDAMVDGEILPIHMSSSSLSSPEARGSPRSSSPSSSSSREALNIAAMKVLAEHNEKDKEWHNNDPSLPDIKNSIYMTDEFRMFSFKIRPCSRAYSHDWTECPFAHPGENARRRDPRRYHYSCVPCPDFRKGSCRRGDACEYAHGVFECWLHPAQYRTRLCKDGLDCARRVCFFAHTTEELRPLYISSGSSIPSPRTPASSMDMATMSPPLASGSPSTLMMNSFFSSSSGHNPNQVNLSTPPMSPSSPGTWSPSNVPALHLPGGGFHASRLRAALNARDISLEVPDFDCQLVNELSCLSPRTLSTQACLNAAVSRSGKYRNMGLNEAPITNHDELFAPDILSSPRSMVHDSPRMLQMEQLRRSSQMHSQLQNQINSQVFSPMVDQMALQMQQAALETQLQSSPRIHTSTPFSLGSLGRMASLGVSDSERQNNQKLVSLSPSMVALSPSMVSAAAQASSVFAQHEKSYHNSPRDLGSGFSLSGWGSPTGKPEWGVQRDDLSKFRKVSSIGVKAEEPDVSWVHRLVKESPLDDDNINNNDSTSG